MGINDVAAHLVPLEEVKTRSVFLDVCTTGPKDMSLGTVWVSEMGMLLM